MYWVPLGLSLVQAHVLALLPGLSLEVLSQSHSHSHFAPLRGWANQAQVPERHLQSCVTFMAARPLKRKLSSRQLQASANQVDAAVEKQERARTQKEEHRMLQEIMGELQQVPEKIQKAYMLVVESDSCLPKKDSVEGSPMEFSEHYQTLSRLPLGYLRSTFLPIFLQHSPLQMSWPKLLSQDGEADFKLMQAVLVVQKSHPFGPKLEPKFVAAYRRRHEMRGHPCAKLSWWHETTSDQLEPRRGSTNSCQSKPKRLLPNDYATATRYTACHHRQWQDQSLPWASMAQSWMPVGRFRKTGTSQRRIACWMRMETTQ